MFRQSSSINDNAAPDNTVTLVQLFDQIYKLVVHKETVINKNA